MNWQLFRFLPFQVFQTANYAFRNADEQGPRKNAGM